jgi:hypothetical protein
MALEAFRLVQVGKESSRGTAVAADKRLVGTLTMTPEHTFQYPVDERKSLAEYKRVRETARRTSMRYEGDATYQQIVDFLGMTLKGGVSGSQVGSTIAYLWTYTPNLAAVNTQDSYTVEYGDNSQNWEADFVVCESMELSIGLGETVQLRADLLGRQATTSTATTIADPDVVEIVANHAQIWIDPAWASLGSTAQASLLTGATIRLPSGLTPVKYADGSLDWSTVVENRRHFELDLEFAMGSVAKTEWDAYVAGTLRAIRIKLTGGMIVGSTPYYLQIDMIGRYTSPPEFFGSRDGLDIYRVTFASMTDGTNELEVKVQTNVLST